MGNRQHQTLRAKDVTDVLTITTTVDVDEYMARMCPNGNIVSRQGFEEAKQAYAIEAHALCDALRSHLPGGLFDALLGAMLHEKAAVFYVAHSKQGHA